MHKRKTANSDRFATSEQERAQATARDGRKGYSKKFSKESSQSRKKGGRASAGKKQQKGTQQTAYKIAELLPEDTIKKLRRMKR